jgi:hypothetical protein
MVISCKFYMVGQWIKVYMLTKYMIYVECDDIILSHHLQPNVECNFIDTTNGIWVVHVSCKLQSQIETFLVVILGALRFTIFGILHHLCCFKICFLMCVGLDYYTTNNTLIIHNLTKLYNITCACSLTKDYPFQTKLPFNLKNLTFYA